ncbi:MAG TPA: hypothetical protein VE990_07505 [Acidimicrobiales bacterium]|nr:hypothetical protein [Acidimicrobiales bacterium]
MQALAVRRLARVGMGAGVDQAVPVRGPAAKEAAFAAGLGGHGRADPDLDPVALAFRHAAVQRHDQVMGVGAGIDGAADLGHPQLDAVVGEDREGETELVAVEGPGGLTDDDRLEATVHPGQRFQQGGRLGSALPRQGAGAADVEVLGDDDAAGRLDKRPGSR